jgi:hypothetical protein
VSSHKTSPEFATSSLSESPSSSVFGDFQTPESLAREIWGALPIDEIHGVVEPTVGVGSFLRSAPDSLRGVPWTCFDINSRYVAETRRLASELGMRRATVRQADAFDLAASDFESLGPTAPILAIGNPPWVTSAAQARSIETNLPYKTNAKFALRGLDAVTGKANFDIAEAILLRLLDALGSFLDLRIAFLVKRSVAMKLARRLLHRAETLSFSSVNAVEHFQASVDAGLFYAHVRTPPLRRASCIWISDEIGAEPVRRAGVRGAGFVEDLDAHAIVARLEAAEPVPWRQGIKHDLAKILELRNTGGRLVNGFGDVVDIESDALVPLYKSSDLANGRPAGRYFPLYQTDLSGPLPDLGRRWPKLAAYLRSHAASFAGRRSRIYSGKYPFALFGVGAYVSAPWKVAVSGLYRTPHFNVIGVGESGRPPVVDDTCYLLPFATEQDAQIVAEHLNGAAARQLITSLADGRAKRPFTKAVLGRIAIPREPWDAAGRAQLTLLR